MMPDSNDVNPQLENKTVQQPPPPQSSAETSEDSRNFLQEFFVRDRRWRVLFGIILLGFGLVAGLVLLRRAQELRELAKADKGNIAIFKFMCEEVGQQDVCNGRDTSLRDYKVDFKVYLGSSDNGEIVQTITVKISDNDRGQGNTGDASQGRKVGEELDLGIYTVCEVPVAYNDAGDRVPLQVFPRPKASEGGSSGGSKQDQYGNNCITVDLNPGEPELKFLNKSLSPTVPQPTPGSSPSPTSTSLATPIPTGVPTVPPVSTPTATAVATPTSTPASSPIADDTLYLRCLNVRIYDRNWSLLTSSDLAKLKRGDLIRITVGGTASKGSIDRARFILNGTPIGESNHIWPGIEGYYIDYTIPEGVRSFSINAQMHHTQIGWF